MEKLHTNMEFVMGYVHVKLMHNVASLWHEKSLETTDNDKVCLWVSKAIFDIN